MKAWDSMSFDEQVAEAARRNDRKARGLPIAETPAELAARVEEDDLRLEKEIQSEVMDTLRAYGFQVYNLSQARASKQSAGLGDVYAVHPWRRRILWWETKTPAGKQRPDQIDFQVLHVQLEIPAVTYVAGGIRALEEYLISIEAAERTASGGIEPKQRRP